MIKYLLYNITKLKKLKKKILFISEKKFREMIKGQEKFFTGLSLLSIILEITHLISSGYLIIEFNSFKYSKL